MDRKYTDAGYGALDAAEAIHNAPIFRSNSLKRFIS